MTALAAQAPQPPAGAAPALPGVTGGIGFDDLGLSAATGLVLVPGGRAGDLFLVDPKTRGVSAIGASRRRPASSRAVTAKASPP